MRTQSIIRLILLVAVSVMSVPIILNFILGLPTPCGITIIGQSTDWLSFWGAYLGGIITAAIGFVSIYYSQKKYEKRQEAEQLKEIEKYREKQASLLQDELIRRVESLNFYSICRILPRFPYKVSREEVINEIDCLKERSEKAELQGIDWSMMSWHDLRSKPRDFDRIYSAMIVSYQSDINSVISLLDAFVEKGPDVIDIKEVERLQEDNRAHASIMTKLLAMPIKDWIMEETGM